MILLEWLVLLFIGFTAAYFTLVQKQPPAPTYTGGVMLMTFGVATFGALRLQVLSGGTEFTYASVGAAVICGVHAMIGLAYMILGATGSIGSQRSDQSPTGSIDILRWFNLR